MSDNTENNNNETEQEETDYEDIVQNDINNLNIGYKKSLKINKEFVPKTINGKFKVDCWHTEKNGSITPRDVNKESHKMCWFTCDVCAHDFKEKIVYILRKNMWCPYCNGLKLCNDDDCDICYQNSFASFG